MVSVWAAGADTLPAGSVTVTERSFGPSALSAKLPFTGLAVPRSIVQAPPAAMVT